MNGRLVRKWLEKMGMRQEELAVRLGMSMGTVQRILSGKANRRTIIALAHIMDIEESELEKASPKSRKAAVL